jgi:hypothetical protein
MLSSLESNGALAESSRQWRLALDALSVLRCRVVNKRATFMPVHGMFGLYFGSSGPASSCLTTRRAGGMCLMNLASLPIFLLLRASLETPFFKRF